MHKPFYASGFLYHVATQQILLQQFHPSTNPLPSWTMIGGESKDGEDAQIAFRRIIREQVKIILDATSFLPVYDYMHTTRNTVHYVWYAEVPVVYTFPSLPIGSVTWFTFKQTTKLSLSDQVKQDVIVSERVINAMARSKEPTPILRPGQRLNLFH